MGISIIYAVSKNGVIGQNNTIPWHLKDELSYFSKVTQDCILIMGRKTYESLPTSKLPGRHLIVVSKDHYSEINQSSAPNNVVSVASIDEALLTCNVMQRILGKKDIFFIGGKDIISKGFTYASQVFVTVVDVQVTEDETNVIVEPIDTDIWNLVKFQQHTDTNTGVSFTTMQYQKIKDC